MIRSPRFPPWPRSTARRLAEASISPNTRRAYSGVIRRLDAWLDGRRLDDAILAAYLAELHDQGRAPASASTAVAAACFRARLAGEPGPAGERTALGPRRLPADRRRARPMASAAVRGRGPRRRPRHLPPAAAPWPRRRVRPRRPRARPPRRRGGAPLHGRDAAERGERPPLGPNGRKPTSPEGGWTFQGFFWVFLGFFGVQYCYATARKRLWVQSPQRSQLAAFPLLGGWPLVFSGIDQHRLSPAPQHTLGMC